MDNRNFTLIIVLFCIMEVGQILCLGSDESVVPVESLTEEICSKKRNGCCSGIFFGDNKSVVQKCFAIHSTMLPDLESPDLPKTFKWYSCFAECMFKKTRFIGKDDKLNMKMVNLEAENLYANRPKEKEYFLKSYKSCEKQAQMNFKLLSSTPGSKNLLKTACRPKFMLLSICLMTYHHTNGCPYFRWFKSGPSDEGQSCDKAREKCYAIDGLEVPIHMTR